MLVHRRVTPSSMLLVLIYTLDAKGQCGAKLLLSKETGGDNNTTAQTWKVRQGEIRRAKHWKPRLYQQKKKRTTTIESIIVLDCRSLLALISSLLSLRL